MQKDHSPGIKRSLTNRSRVTNGTRMLEGVDGRSPTARRYRDLVESFTHDLGGMAQLSEADRSLVRQAATLTVRSEQLQAAIVRGEPVDPDELIRLTNTTRRTLAGIRRKEPPKETLSDYLARKQGAVA
jgi:hypothetical protein